MACLTFFVALSALLRAVGLIEVIRTVFHTCVFVKEEGSLTGKALIVLSSSTCATFSVTYKALVFRLIFVKPLLKNFIYSNYIIR